jgi:hypothetical protein
MKIMNHKRLGYCVDESIAADESGASITYQWRENGQIQSWTAGGD